MQFCRRAVDTHDEQPNWPFCSPRILRHKIIRSLLLQVRTAILGMLDAWVTVVPVERVLPSVADAIAAPKASSEGKLTGLKWLATVLDHGRASKGLAAVLRSATLGMNDKASDVREAGTTLMTLMLEVRHRHFWITLCLPCIPLPGCVCWHGSQSFCYNYYPNSQLVIATQQHRPTR
jgi:hypothetical protein